jgi:hypothetical protein
MLCSQEVFIGDEKSIAYSTKRQPFMLQRVRGDLHTKFSICATVAGGTARWLDGSVEILCPPRGRFLMMPGILLMLILYRNKELTHVVCTMPSDEL